MNIRSPMPASPPHAEPGDAAIAERLAAVERAARSAAMPTVPTTIAAERATNPFLRAADAAEFARTSRWPRIVIADEHRSRRYE